MKRDIRAVYIGKPLAIKNDILELRYGMTGEFVDVFTTERQTGNLLQLPAFIPDDVNFPYVNVKRKDLYFQNV